MTLRVFEPAVDGLADVVQALRGWQHDGGPVQLHPGDLGWQSRAGAPATAAAVRVWVRDGTPVAVGMLDAPDLLRLAVAPDVDDDVEVARDLADDLGRPDAGVLADGPASVETRAGAALRTELVARGWVDGEPWTPLDRDLAGPVEDADLAVEVVGAARAAERVAVQRAAFDTSTFTVEGWHAMAGGVAYADARCLLGRDRHGAAVAVATVWSAGPGRPGLLEPVGVHRDHRGRGYGTAISRAAAAALRTMGASHATVCTPAANAGAVATYAAAGFTRLPDVPDLRRPA